MLKILKYGFVWPASALASLLAVYILAALLCALIPQNREFEPPRPPQPGVLIYVLDNGVHTDIAMPVIHQGEGGTLDWTDFFVAPEAFSDRRSDHDNFFTVVGWGQKDIFMSELDLQDMTPSMALRGLLNPEGVVRVYWSSVPVRDFWDPAHVRPVYISAAKYQELAAFIKQSCVTGRDGRAISREGAGSEAAFYASPLRYDPINTCNQWANKALAAAGVRVPVWSPFVQGIRYQLDLRKRFLKIMHELSAYKPYWQYPAALADSRPVQSPLEQPREKSLQAASLSPSNNSRAALKL